MSKNDSTLTAEHLRELLQYDPKTGIFKWVKNVGGRGKAGALAGKRGNRGYICIGVCGAVYLAHRLAWLYMQGEWPKGQIDHINRIKNDNSMSNLRIVNGSENHENTGIRKDNSSGYKGVCFDKQCGKWKAQIQYGLKRSTIGVFLTPELAAEAYAKAAQKHHKLNPFASGNL